MRGWLAGYSNDDGFRRGTSTTRDDTGNGACETIYVDEFQIDRHEVTVAEYAACVEHGTRHVHQVQGAAVHACRLLQVTAGAIIASQAGQRFRQGFAVGLVFAVFLSYGK